MRKNRKKWPGRLLIGLGLAILLAGLTLYALGVHAWLPMAQSELFPWAVMVVGMVFLVAGACELYLPKTRQQEIEERDERNISNANAAKATAYEVGTVLFAVALLALSRLGYLGTVAFLTLAAVFVGVQIIFVARLWYLERTR